jgi:hypothetical protein
MNLSKILLQELLRTAALASILLALLAVPYHSGQITLVDAFLNLAGAGLVLYALLCHSRLRAGEECVLGKWVYAGLALTSLLLLLALADLAGYPSFVYGLLPLAKGALLVAGLLWLGWRLQHRRQRA